MTLIEHWNEFVAVPPEGRSWYQIVAWWEARRLAYNAFAIALVIVVGAFALLVPMIAEPDSPFFGAFVFVLIINICYTLGWIVELAWRLLSRRDAPGVAPRLLKLGLLLTIFVPALSLVLSVLSGLV